ncbi:MAG: hypothetical protein NC218_11005 [Acetobacter sp.]|nr:hypothetical protein [Acetobacter sp.]
MDIREKIAKIKSEMKLRAVKLATMATLLGGTTAVSSCTEQNKDTDIDENKDKIENVDNSRTSVVFRLKQENGKVGSSNHILMENGDELDTDDFYFEKKRGNKSIFLEPGDTVTYEGKDIKAVRYKDGYGKQVNFGKIGKIQKDRGR